MASETIEEEIARYTVESDNWQRRAATLEQAMQRVTAELTAERDAAREERDAARAEAEGMQHKAGLDARIIEGLRECLEKTEKRYIEAKARQVPRALVGLLGVIRREAAAAEKMIL